MSVRNRRWSFLRDGRSVVLMVMAVGAWLPAHAAAGDEVLASELPQADRDEAELALRGVLRNAQRLHSGIVHISGTVRCRVEGLPELLGPVQSLYAFEFEGDKLRYDNEEAQYVRTLNASRGIGPAEMRQVKPVVFARRLCYARNGEYSACWAQSGKASRTDLMLRMPDAELRMGLGRTHHLFDIRAVGLLDFRAFEQGSRAIEIVEDLLQQRLVQLDRKGRLVTIVVEEERSRTTVVVDTEDGFRPIERRLESLSDPARCMSRTDWGRQNGVAVPVRMVYRLDVPQAGHNAEYVLEFHWESVNEPVDPKYFDYHSFDIPADLHVYVSDARSGEPRTVGKWMGEGVVNEQDVGPE